MWLSFLALCMVLHDTQRLPVAVRGHSGLLEHPLLCLSSKKMPVKEGWTCFPVLVSGHRMRWTHFLQKVISHVENTTTEEGLEKIKLFSLKKRIVMDLTKIEIHYTAGPLRTQLKHLKNPCDKKYDEALL